LTLEAATALAQQATRNYAKRQETWLRRQLPPAEADSMAVIEQFSKSLRADTFSKIRQFLLTGS